MISSEDKNNKRRDTFSTKECEGKSLHTDKKLGKKRANNKTLEKTDKAKGQDTENNRSC